MKQNVLNFCISPLIEWYEENCRTLPFRESRLPYHIWVSEIMLQQTRVSTAVPYFERFVKALPTIALLAACDEEKLLKLWQGLGYYNRVRNLQKGAREVCEKFGGELPADYDQLRSITGIGEYTAGAIASIAFGLKTPAVDGNVLRVVSRLCGDESDITGIGLRREYADVLRPLMPDGKESEFTQALMELGALVCVPNGEPHCSSCPLRFWCVAHNEGTTDSIPFKSAKKARRVESRDVYLVFSDDGKVLLHKREDRGLLAGLWEFPNFLEGEETPSFLKGLELEKGIRAKHVFSHVEWQMQALITQTSLDVCDDRFVFASVEELENLYAVPSAFSAFFKVVAEKIS